MPAHSLFAVAAPGFEPTVAREIRALLGRDVEEVPGGVRFKGELTEAAALVLWARTPARLLVEVGEIPAGSPQELQAQARRLDWSPFLFPGQPVEVRASTNQGKVGRVDNAIQKVENALKDALRGPRREGPKRTAMEVSVRVEGRRALLSVDAGGGLLHRRGWRLDAAKAPLRENLAASCLLALGWSPGEPLVDPCCGSGTFPIEAALWSGNRAPGLHRSPPPVVAFPSFPRRVWPRMVEEAHTLSRPIPQNVRAADRDPGAVRATRDNAGRAGVDLLVEQKDITDPWKEPLPEGGLVIINPPWGVRVAENARLGPVYHHFARGLREQHPGRRLGVVCPDKALARRLVPDLEPVLNFHSGGVPITLWRGTIPG